MRWSSWRSAAADVLRSTAHWLAILSLIALIFLCLLWESKLAPLRPGGSLLMLKALPLLLPLFGLLRERVIAYKWTLLLVLAYATEALVRIWTDTGLSRTLAWWELVLAVLLFASCALFVKLPRAAAAG